MKLKHYLQGHVSPWLILVAATLMWRLLYAYWTPVYQRYIVPPGDDAVFHISTINDILQGHFSLFSGTYPQGFHFVAAFFAWLFHLTGLEAAMWIAPMLIVLPIIVIYYVGSQIFKSDVAGAMAGAAWGFLALGPIRALGDGNYPNLFAASILLPLTILFIYRSVHLPQKKNIIPAFLLLIIIALTHHLTLIYLIVIAAPWMAVIIAERLHGFKNRHTSVRKTKRIIVLGIAAIVLLIAFYRPLLAPYLWALLHGQSLVQALGADNKALDLLRLLEINGSMLMIGGLMSLVVLVISNESKHLKLLLVGWILILIAISTMPFLVLQGRFARELAIPCALVIGYAAAAFVTFAARHKARAGAVFIICAVLLVDVLASFHRTFALPDPFFPLMRVQHDEEAAYPLLNTITPDGTIILAANSNPFLPFLVDHPVIVPPIPQDIVDILRQPISIVYIGARPALSDGYPYFARYDEISQALRAIPGLTVVATLPNGSTIYRLTR